MLKNATTKETTKHTPGPWHVCRLDWRSVECTDTGLIVADIRSPIPENGREDALLIAAAPELLAACEGALRIAEGDDTSGLGWKAIDALREAIAKAKGVAAWT